jgi:hypothetical protein
MGGEKRLPGGLPLATRGRLNAVFFQGAAHGCIREGIPEVGQGSVDAVIALGRVFACQPHQGADLAVVPLLGHEQSAPTQSALRRPLRRRFGIHNGFPTRRVGDRTVGEVFSGPAAPKRLAGRKSKNNLIPLRIAL